MLALFFPASLLAEPVTLRHAVELALQHSTGVDISAADEQHASASYRELRNSYIPQLNAGAGIGWSDGFPLSLEGAAPSLFNVNAQSALINPALKDFIRAAQSDVKANMLRTKDQRNQIIQDTVLSYAELAKWERRLSGLARNRSRGAEMQSAVAERVKEGIDSEMDGSKARLSVARVRCASPRPAARPMFYASIFPNSRECRLPLSKSILIRCQLYLRQSKTRYSLGKATEANPAVEAAVEHARAQYLRVAGERRSLWPSIDFAAQYANLATLQ